MKHLVTLIGFIAGITLANDNKIVEIKINSECVTYVDTTVIVGNNLVATDDSTLVLTIPYKTCYVKGEYKGVCRSQDFVFSVRAFTGDMKYMYINPRISIDGAYVDSRNVPMVDIGKWHNVNSNSKIQKNSINEFLLVYSMSMIMYYIEHH